MMCWQALLSVRTFLWIKYQHGREIMPQLLWLPNFWRPQQMFVSTTCVDWRFYDKIVMEITNSWSRKLSFSVTLSSSEFDPMLNEIRYIPVWKLRLEFCWFVSWLSPSMTTALLPTLPYAFSNQFPSLQSRVGKHHQLFRQLPLSIATCRLQ